MLLDGDSSSTVLQENRRREFGSDTYLGLIAVALCGNSAFEWIEDAFWRSYIAGHYTEDNTICIQVTLGDVEEDCWTRLVKDSNEDIEIELTVDEDDDFAVEEYGDNPEKIAHTVATIDKARQNYYNYHTCQKWGDYRNYNLSINSSYITEEEAASLIAEYVERRTYRDETRDE